MERSNAMSALLPSRRPGLPGVHHSQAPSESSASHSAPLGVPFSSSSSSSSGAIFWRLLHVTCCVLSAVLGFRCSRFIFLLFLAASSDDLNLDQQLHRQSLESVVYRSPHQPLSPPPLPPPPPPPPSPPPPSPFASHVAVGRHGILVRPSSHPDPVEVARAHRILARVQQEQRLRYSGVRNPRPLLVVTPTYARTFQALHLAGLLHSLKLLPYPLTWLVVDASPSSGPGFNETAAFLARSGLNFVHLPFPEPMPLHWSSRHAFEVRMRLYALRLIREQQLEGIIVFADDSNVHSMELFDEVQKVKWMGAVSVGILADSPVGLGPLSEDNGKNSRLPVQGPACDSLGQLVGWHAYNLLLHANGSAMFPDDARIGLPRKIEWAGFAMNSRLLWVEAKEKPEWFRDLDYVDMEGEEINSPLDLLKDSTSVEPLGNCGKKVLLWWLRLEARYDSKFPSGWVIDPPVDITVSAKHLPWPEAPPKFLSKRMLTYQEYLDRSSTIGGGLRYSSNSKAKHEEHVDTQIPEMSQLKET